MGVNLALSFFVGARIAAKIMQFIANSVMISPNVPGNIIGRGQVAALNMVFRVDLPTAIQKTRSVLKFCMSFRNGVSLPHLMNFSYLQRAWDAAILTLQDLMSPAVDYAVDLNNRSCPICLNPVLSWKVRIPACRHPMHMKCWKAYKNRMTACNRVVTRPICQFDTQRHCYRVWL
jgi:hypothetical protein